MDTQRADPQQLSTKPPDANQRRSTRLLISVPIVISGKNARGEVFREETRTISISRQGASIATAQPMAAGAEITIENPPLHLAVKARVIRFFEKSSQDDLNQIGVELLEARNVWGIQYPPGDWQRAQTRTQTALKTSPEVTPPASQPEKSPSLNVTYTIDLPTRATDVRHAPHPQPETSKPPGQTGLPNLESEAEKLLRATGMKLAKVAGQIDAKLQANLHNALSRLEEREKALSTLNLEINSILNRAQETSSHLEELFSNLDAARRRTREEVEQARQSLQEITEQLVNSAAEDAVKRVSQNLESTTSEFSAEALRIAREQVLALAQEFRQEIRDSFQAVTADQLSSAAQQLQARQAKMIEEAQGHLSQILRVGLENFKGELQQGAQQFHETTLAGIAQEHAAQASQELDRQKAALDQQIQHGIQQAVASALEGFQAEISQSAESFRQNFVQELQQGAQQFRETTLAGISQEHAALASQELNRQKATLDQQIQQGIQQAVASALEGFQAEISQSAETFRQNFVQELQQGAQQFRETTLAGIAQEHAALASQELDRQKAALDQQIQQGIQQAVASALEGFQAEISQSAETFRQSFVQELQLGAQQFRETTLAGIAQEHAALASQELNRQKAALDQQIQQGIQQAVASALEGFRAEISQSAENFRESFVQELQQFRETALASLAQSSQELDRQKAALDEQIQQGIQQAVASALEGFQAEISQSAESFRQSFIQELQQGAQQFRETTLASIAQECAARASLELDRQKAETHEEIKEQVQRITRSALEGFQMQLQQSSESFRESATSTIVQQGTARAIVEIQARQEELVEQAKNQFQLVLRSSLQGLQAEINQVEQGFRDFALPALTQECIAKSTAALQSEESAVVERIQRQADLILHSATESCQAESERVARTLRESTLPKLAEECVARTAQALQTTQRDVVNQATGQMKNAMQSTLESFRHELRTTQQQFKDEAQALLKLPVEQINQHARDTLEITREELASLRSGSIDETHAQLAAITRATLESITAEAKAIAEEYRAQLRDTFDALKEKGVTAVEGSIREAVERSRESLLRQLQSDAEDLTTIAVTQFRNKADEAIREATEAVNKQVGAAAFVVKDWLDQANQRLDANLAKLETRSDTALQAIENRSRDVSRGILEKLQRESEVLIEDLRSRIGSAAEALAFRAHRTPDFSSEKPPETTSEQPRKTPARSSK